NQAGHLFDTLNDYKIHHLVGKFDVDNASDNDTALEEIRHRSQAEGYLSFDPVEDRPNVDAFESGNRSQPDREATDDIAELDRWRRKGPLGRLHNVL
ncbi:hypothetical protein FN846DRAFT_764251, partial [Sphaerosporella brunnea]